MSSANGRIGRRTRGRCSPAGKRMSASATFLSASETTCAPRSEHALPTLRGGEKAPGAVALVVVGAGDVDGVQLLARRPAMREPTRKRARAGPCAEADHYLFRNGRCSILCAAIL